MCPIGHGPRGARGYGRDMKRSSRLGSARTERPPAPAQKSEKRPVGLHALQRDAGNQAVTHLLSRAPDLDPRRVVEANPQWVEGKPKEKSAPKHANRADALSYEQQPEALREVLKRSFDEGAASWFLRLSDEARSNLVYTYNRMITYGIWEHVRFIRHIVAGEAPVNLGPVQLVVAGKSQSLVFEVYDGRALRDTMLSSKDTYKDPSFGRDTGPAGALHPGQTSMREFTRTTRDGLHLSVGIGTDADAHIDKVSATNQPEQQTSQMDLVRSLEHHWQEVWPEFLRVAPGWLTNIPRHVYNWLVDKLKHVGVGPRFRAVLRSIPEAFFNLVAHAVGILDAVWAGTTFKPANKVEHPDPSQRERDTDFVTLKEYRFGSSGRPALPPSSAPRDQASMDAQLTEAVAGAIATGVVRPRSHGKQDSGDYADAHTVGLAIAGKILRQAKAGGITIGIELGGQYDTLKPAEVAEVAQQLTQIGRAARESLAAALKARGDSLGDAVLGVRSATVPLGGTLTHIPLH